MLGSSFFYHEVDNGLNYGCMRNLMHTNLFVVHLKTNKVELLQNSPTMLYIFYCPSNGIAFIAVANKNTYSQLICHYEG